MTIKRNLTSEPISNNIHRREIPVYCPHCQEQGVRNDTTILKPRVDYELYDKDDWLQCYHCGKVIMKPDIPRQGELTTDIQTITSKISINRETEMDVRDRHRRGFNERLDREDHREIKDPDVRKALKKGQTLISYNES